MKDIIETVAAIPNVAVLVMVIVVCTASILMAVVVFGRKFTVKLGKIHAEFAPNGGSSMKDAMNRIETAQKTMAKVQKNHTARLLKLEKPITAIAEVVPLLDPNKTKRKKTS